MGNRLRVVVDDKEVFNVVDPDPLSGSDRTIVGLFGWLAESIITRVKISTLGAPWKSDILDIADRQSLKGNYDVAMALVKEVVESFPEPARLERARNTEQMIKRRQKMTHDLAGWRNLRALGVELGAGAAFAAGCMAAKRGWTRRKAAL